METSRLGGLSVSSRRLYSPSPCILSRLFPILSIITCFCLPARRFIYKLSERRRGGNNGGSQATSPNALFCAKAAEESEQQGLASLSGIRGPFPPRAQMFRTLSTCDIIGPLVQNSFHSSKPRVAQHPGLRLPPPGEKQQGRQGRPRGPFSFSTPKQKQQQEQPPMDIEDRAAELSGQWQQPLGMLPG